MTDPIVSFLYRIGSTVAPSPAPAVTATGGTYRSTPGRQRLVLIDPPELDRLALAHQARVMRFTRAASVRAALGKAAVDAGRMLRGGAELDETQRSELMDACRALADFQDGAG